MKMKPYYNFKIENNINIVCILQYTMSDTIELDNQIHLQRFKNIPPHPSYIAGFCKVYESELSKERFDYYINLREKVYEYNKPIVTVL